MVNNVKKKAMGMIMSKNQSTRDADGHSVKVNACTPREIDEPPP